MTLRGTGSRFGVACIGCALSFACGHFAADDPIPSGSAGVASTNAAGAAVSAGAPAEAEAGGSLASGGVGANPDETPGEGGSTSGGAAGAAGSTAVAPDAGAAGAGAGAPDAGAPNVDVLAPERSVLESNPDALQYLTLERVLGRVNATVAAEDVYSAFVRSFEPRAAGDQDPAPRCDDESPALGGLSTLNGFSIPCPAEALGLLSQLGAWKPLSVANRFDLAPRGGANCGEQHLSFYYVRGLTNQPQFPLQAFLRFAAVIVNPSPDLGLEGCRPLVDYWASLSRSEYDVPAERASAHELAFLGPNPAAPNPPPGPEVTALVNAGFQPFMSPEHFGHAGRLQLLYLGDFGAWHFFEHALVSANEGVVLRRPLTQSLPVGALLRDDPKRTQCVSSLLDSVPNLLDEDVNLQRLDIDPVCFAGTESSTDERLVAGLTDGALGNDLVQQLDDTMQKDYSASGLSGYDVAARAEFAGTCVGCHDLVDSPWSSPSTVAHVNNRRTEPCGSTGPDLTQSCYARSPLLKTAFMPHWTQILSDFWQYPGEFPLPQSAGTAVDGAALVRQNP